MMPSPDLDDLYAEIILDHYKSPRNHHLLDSPALSAEGWEGRLEVALQAEAHEPIDVTRLRAGSGPDQLPLW